MRLACMLATALAGTACFQWEPRLRHFPEVEGFVADRDTGRPIPGALVFVTYYSANLVDGHSQYRTSWSSSEADGRFSIPGAWRVTLPRIGEPGIVVAHPTYGCWRPSAFPLSLETPLNVQLSVATLDAVESCRLWCEYCLHGDTCMKLRALMCGDEAHLLPDGSPRSTGARYRMQRLGQWRFFRGRDRIWATGEFDRGEAHGRWDFYDEDGSLIRTESYCRGRAGRCPTGLP